MLDKLVLVSKTELWLIYTNRGPVVITGPDAVALYTWMNTKTVLVLAEFTAGLSNDLETTQIAA